MLICYKIVLKLYYPFIKTYDKQILNFPKYKTLK